MCFVTAISLNFNEHFINLNNKCWHIMYNKYRYVFVPIQYYAQMEAIF